jgi:hypothetical protein
MEMLKKTGIDWRERRSISKLHIGQSVKVWLDQGATKSVKIGRGVRHHFYLTYIVNTLPRKVLKVLETSK